MTSNDNEKLSREQIDQLLELLSSDDDFRERFSNDPGEALKQIGWTRGCPSCMQVDTLADMATIAAAREQLREQLMAEGTHEVIFQLDASTLENGKG